jgi:hypothetical protein
VKYGKWSQPGVPHKGWKCIGIEDLEEPDETCEMCEKETIRYVHIMEHPDYGELRCGCVCAGNMEEDKKRAEEREKKRKNLTKRRINWLTRRWRVSAKGNEFLNTDGANIVIFRQSFIFRARITPQEPDDLCFEQYVTRQYMTSDEAKLAAFDRIFLDVAA